MFDMILIGVLSTAPERLVARGRVTVMPADGPVTVLVKLTVHVSNVEGGDVQFDPKPFRADRLAVRT